MWHIMVQNHTVNGGLYTTDLRKSRRSYLEA